MPEVHQAQSDQVMGRCIICKKETNKTLFKTAIVHTYICSEECLIKYFEPLGKKKIVIQTKVGGETDYWLE